MPRRETSGRACSQSTVRIGRNPDCELIFKHNQVFRLHLTRSKDGAKYFTEDSSSNGTFPSDRPDGAASQDAASQESPDANRRTATQRGRQTLSQEHG
ncbi:MAG: FHA domain-containing protein [Gammaproteobacteria bacterium]|nr:FHA domain-containing protein [Gammaproteobacteria bacterium]